MTTTLVVSRRTELESEIDDAIVRFRGDLLRIGKAFAEIKDGRLYLPEFPTFEAYVTAVWHMPPTRAIEIAAGWKIADQGAHQTRIEDMPLYAHAYFANVVEDSSRPLGGLDLFEREGAREVARTIGTPKSRILQDMVEEHQATPENLASMTGPEQQEKLRAVNADMARKFGEEQAAEFEAQTWKKAKRQVEQLNDDPAIGKYLRPGREDALRNLMALFAKGGVGCCENEEIRS